MISGRMEGRHWEYLAALLFVRPLRFLLDPQVIIISKTSVMKKNVDLHVV